MMLTMERLPWSIPSVLTDGDISLFRAEDRVFEAMLDGWRAQMLARGLTTEWIKSSASIVTRFHAFTNDYPWKWQAHDVDEYLAGLRSREKPVTLTTLRSYSSAIRIFCAYITDSRYGWVSYCEQAFGDIPSQICFEWNSPKHATDDAAPEGRRPFTRNELQTFFDTVDDLVDQEFAAGSKRWLPALRDSIAFKVCYAYGLRRRELTMLETVDFGPNPHVPAYKGFGCTEVRFAKGTSGSGPRRRTVLTSPEFDWVVGLLGFWLSDEGRARFPTADRTLSLWPSERAGRLDVRSFDRSFQSVRELAGLPEKLTMHSLRHSYVTHQIEAGYDPAFVQEQVGHSYASTTGLYTHVSQRFQAQDRATDDRAAHNPAGAVMPDQRRMGYHWNLRKVMASRNLWKTSELQPLLRSRGINLSDTQVYRLITGTPERIPARTFAALCDILDCSPNDLFEPFVEIRAAASVNAPRHTEGIAAVPNKPIARRIKLLPDPSNPADE